MTTKTGNTDKPAKLSEAQDALLAYHSAGTIRPFVFPAETILFSKGEIRHCAFLIDKGEVHIYGNDDGGPEKLLCVLGEGEIFGEMALIDSTPRTATAVTKTETEVFVIPRNAMQHRMRGIDPIASLFISLLIERYRTTRIHMPETIKQDGEGDFIRKVSKYDSLPEDVLKLRDTDGQRAIALQEMKLEQELRAGITENQFIPVFQPIMKLPEEKLIGFEALIRWQHPEKGLLTPFHFIPVAERTGIVQHLDRMMLEKACEALPEIKKQAHDNDDIFISVNISGINFETDDLINNIKNTLEKHNTDPKNIRLEITESALIEEADSAEKVLQGLKDLGLSIALDDFGTGYSSLGYLHKFSIDTIKIDRSFVAQMHDSPKSIDIVNAIVGLARTFKLSLVAEGIETDKDASVIKELGCDMGQGYHYAKPLEIDKTLEFIKEQLE